MKKKLLFFFIVFTSAIYAQVPSNDRCSNARAIVLNNNSACLNATNLNATSDGYIDDCDTGMPGNEVWFTFVATNANNTVTITPSGSTPITDIVVTLTTTGCNSDAYDVCNSASGTDQVVATLGLTPGTQVWVSVESNGSDGDFQICINSIPAAVSPGNTCASATVLCDKSDVNITNLSGFSSSGTTPSCFNLGYSVQKDVWVTFTVGVTGTLEFIGTPLAAVEYDWALFDVTSGCLGTEVACNYNYAGLFGGPEACDFLGAPFGMLSDASGQDCPYEFEAPITVIAGRTYALLVDNFDQTDDGFTLEWGGTFEMGSSANFDVSPQSSCSAPLKLQLLITQLGQ